LKRFERTFAVIGMLAAEFLTSFATYGVWAGHAIQYRPAAMFESISRYALCGEAPLLRELGFDTQSMRGLPRLRFETRPGRSR
jgi:hypothetical protein